MKLDLERDYFFVPKIYEHKVFEAIPNIISVDGPDGVGKSTFSKVLFDLLSNVSDRKDSVVLMSPTKFEYSGDARKYKEKLREVNFEIEKKLFLLDKYIFNDDSKDIEKLSKKISSVKRFWSIKSNRVFIAAIKANYRLAHEETKKGKIVICDSSDIRELAYILDNSYCDENEGIGVIRSTIRWFLSGNMTNGVIPGNRIVLNSTITDIHHNLTHRQKKDIGDPKDYFGTERRIKCYEKSIEFIREIKSEPTVNWIDIINTSLPERDIENYLKIVLGKDIIQRIRNTSINC